MNNLENHLLKTIIAYNTNETITVAVNVLQSNFGSKLLMRVILDRLAEQIVEASDKQIEEILTILALIKDDLKEKRALVRVLEKKVSFMTLFLSYEK